MTEHSHTHTHEHHHGAVNLEEVIALLNYMIDHNKHHTAEIHGMAHGLTGESEKLLHDAVSRFEEGTQKLESALHLLRGE